MLKRKAQVIKPEEYEDDKQAAHGQVMRFCAEQGVSHADFPPSLRARLNECRGREASKPSKRKGEKTEKPTKRPKPAATEKAAKRKRKACKV